MTEEELAAIRSRYDNAHVDLDREAEFKAHARRDVPALLAEITRLREENQRLHDKTERLRGSIDALRDGP